MIELWYILVENFCCRNHVLPLRSETVKHTIPGEEGNVYIGRKKEETTQKSLDYFWCNPLSLNWQIHTGMYYRLLELESRSYIPALYSESKPQNISNWKLARMKGSTSIMCTCLRISDK